MTESLPVKQLRIRHRSLGIITLVTILVGFHSFASAKTPTRLLSAYKPTTVLSKKHSSKSLENLLANPNNPSTKFIAQLRKAQENPKPKPKPKPQVSAENLVNTAYIAPQTQVQAPTIARSDEWYRNYIFSHEGGLSSINSRGCKGLGQDCNGQLEKDCPYWYKDLSCQLAFWERYKTARYGTWARAYAFRSTHNWW